MTDPTTAVGFLTEATAFINDLGMMPFVGAVFIAGLAFYSIRKAISAARDGGGGSDSLPPCDPC